MEVGCSTKEWLGVGGSLQLCSLEAGTPGLSNTWQRVRHTAAPLSTNEWELPNSLSSELLSKCRNCSPEAHGYGGEPWL